MKGRNFGQVFTWDMIFGMGIFIGILVLIAYMWDSAVSEIHDAELIYEMGWIATTVGEQLVRTTGSPQDWSGSNVRVYGLADSKDILGFDSSVGRIIDLDKLLYLVDESYMNYSVVRAVLLGTSKYDFYIEVSCKDGTSGCFNDIYVDQASGLYTCNNGFKFHITDHITQVDGTSCIIGRYVQPQTATYITHSTKNAVFSEKLNVSNIFFFGEQVLDKEIEFKVVIYTGGIPSKLCIDPLEMTVAKDKEVTFDITATDIVDMYAIEFNLTYTPGALNYSTLLDGNFLTCMGYPKTSFWDYGEGWLMYTATRQGSVPGCSGNGTIATITLNATSTSPLYLRDAKIVDSSSPQPKGLPFTICIGNVTVT